MLHSLKFLRHFSLVYPVHNLLASMVIECNETVLLQVTLECPYLRVGDLGLLMRPGVLIVLDLVVQNLVDF